ncbi:precorrin-2 C(20)-methyltransferase [Luteococcus sp. OSA5]|uniref:precorrin-2 C(20)-methyltransferase n=1 Tax=Luteococcus sp. OSA5 TaxID=3401630 RepID=UPI003B439F2D
MNHARLVGVGVGPGDPQLVTLAAATALRQADVVLVPATEKSADGPGRAERIVTTVTPEARIERIGFAMREQGRSARRRESWQAAAEAALAHFAAGPATVAMATIGDPAVYSTFSYLAATVRESLPELEVSWIPGITAMQALAAASGTPLVEGNEVLALAPATLGVDGLAPVLEAADSVCIYKGGRQLGALRELITDRGRTGIVGSEVSLPEQHLARLDELDDDARTGYFSAVLSTPARTNIGGSL